MRPFIADYIDTFGVKKKSKFTASFDVGDLSESDDAESDDLEQMLSDNMSADSVSDWSIGSGICTQLDKGQIKKYGTGIFVAKYLDLIA